MEWNQSGRPGLKSALTIGLLAALALVTSVWVGYWAVTGNSLLGEFFYYRQGEGLDVRDGAFVARMSDEEYVLLAREGALGGRCLEFAAAGPGVERVQLKVTDRQGNAFESPLLEESDVYELPAEASGWSVYARVAEGERQEGDWVATFYAGSQ